jgi:hypothetical protein
VEVHRAATLVLSDLDVRDAHTAAQPTLRQLEEPRELARDLDRRPAPTVARPGPRRS